MSWLTEDPSAKAFVQAYAGTYRLGKVYGGSGYWEYETGFGVSDLSVSVDARGGARLSGRVDGVAVSAASYVSTDLEDAWIDFYVNVGGREFSVTVDLGSGGWAYAEVEALHCHYCAVDDDYYDDEW